MAIKEELWRWRVVKARLLVEMAFEEGNKKRNLKRIYNRVGKFTCCVGYETFLDYLDETKYDVSDLVPPEWLVTSLWERVLPFRDVEKEAPYELQKRLARPLPERKAEKAARKRREAEEPKKYAVEQCATENEQNAKEQRVPEMQLS